LQAGRTVCTRNREVIPGQILDARRLSLAFFFLLLSAVAWAEGIDANAVAQTPARFYWAVQVKDYAQAWSLLTEATKARLAAVVAEEAKMPTPDVRALFEKSDPSVCQGFWESFRTGTRAELFVGLTYTYAGDMEGAHIVEVTDPGSTQNKPLQMIVKDEGGYKYGLAETFNL
jgi:hypothetical protein